MGATRLQHDIIFYTDFFSRNFRVYACTDCYIQFVANARNFYACATVYKTSKTCYRVMWYQCFSQKHKFSQYKSFKTVSELCYYLDALSVKLV